MKKTKKKHFLHPNTTFSYSQKKYTPQKVYKKILQPKKNYKIPQIGRL